MSKAKIGITNGMRGTFVVLYDADKNVMLAVPEAWGWAEAEDVPCDSSVPTREEYSRWKRTKRGKSQTKK